MQSRMQKISVCLRQIRGEALFAASYLLTQGFSGCKARQRETCQGDSCERDSGKGDTGEEKPWVSSVNSIQFEVCRLAILLTVQIAENFDSKYSNKKVCDSLLLRFIVIASSLRVTLRIPQGNKSPKAKVNKIKTPCFK